jgi:hypothetical protein
MKRLIGRTDMEDALKKLDELTQEEVRMAIAENLRATHAVDQSVARVDRRVGGVSDQVARVDDRVVNVDNMVAIVNDTVKDIDTALDQIRCSSYSYLISADYRTLTYF